jgi:hypothetical protein
MSIVDHGRVPARNTHSHSVVGGQTTDQSVQSTQVGRGKPSTNAAAEIGAQLKNEIGGSPAFFLSQASEKIGSLIKPSAEELGSVKLQSFGKIKALTGDLKKAFLENPTNTGNEASLIGTSQMGLRGYYNRLGASVNQLAATNKAFAVKPGDKPNGGEQANPSVGIGRKAFGGSGDARSVFGELTNKIGNTPGRPVGGGLGGGLLAELAAKAARGAATQSVSKSGQSSGISTAAPLEAQNKQFFSSAIVLQKDPNGKLSFEGEAYSFKEAIFVPSSGENNELYTQSYAKRVGDRNTGQKEIEFGPNSSNEGALVSKRNGGHAQLKKAAMANRILDLNANLSGANQKLFGGGFTVLREKGSDGNVKNFITVSFTSRQLNIGSDGNATQDAKVPENLQQTFMQASADIAGLPVYASQEAFRKGDPPLAVPVGYQG